MKPKVIILLTATINPNGTAHTKLQNPTIRRQQYIDAINFYLNKTDIKIVVCENSNTDISFEFNPCEWPDRIEFLTFDGNNYDKSKGKGYGEAKIIQYALDNSESIKGSDVIIKITGRVKILNINEIYKKIKTKHSIGMEMWRHGWAHSVCFYCPKNWIMDAIIEKGEELNDFGYNFHNMIFDYSYYNTAIPIIPVFPIIEGICAGSNEKYSNDIIYQRKLDHFNVMRTRAVGISKLIYYSKWMFSRIIIKFIYFFK